MMGIYEADTEMRPTHAEIGGFIARCSLLDHRVSQFIARWFSSHEKQKFLSYTLKAMPFAEKRQVIEARLTKWHKDVDGLRAAMSEISAVIERRNLVATGILSRRSSGILCIKSFSGVQIISDEGAIDIIEIAELAGWSEKAIELAERLIALGLSLRDTAN